MGSNDRSEEQEQRPGLIDRIEEMKSLRRVFDAYMDYRGSIEDDIIRWERSFHRLTASHCALVPELPAKYAALRKCAIQNALLINTMLQAFDLPYEIPGPDETPEDYVDNLLRYEEGVSGVPAASLNPVQEVVTPEVGLDGTRAQTHFQNNARQSGQKRSRLEGSSIGQTADTVTSVSSANQSLPSVRQTTEADNVSSDVDLDPLEADGGANQNRPNQVGLQYHRHVPPGDVEKVRCVLRNIVRDWTADGAIERSECYGPILSELQRCFPDINPANPPKCAVPGAGLARLALEIARLGFECQGNEFSYYTLIVSSFILNMTDRENEWEFYPYIHSQSNVRQDDDMWRPVTFPDLHPGSAGIGDNFSMCAGDFLEVYGGAQQAGAWDSVVTCFFIDTAHNVIAYLEVIARMLKPGGVWINFGPLLYHFAEAYQFDGADDLSVELSLETVLRIAQSFGLTLKRDPQFVSTSYTANPRSMMATRYQCAFWTMVKS